MDQKYVVYNALLPETDDSLIKNQRTTFVVLLQGAQARHQVNVKINVIVLHIVHVFFSLGSERLRSFKL